MSGSGFAASSKHQCGPTYIPRRPKHRPAYHRISPFSSSSGGPKDHERLRGNDNPGSDESPSHVCNCGHAPYDTQHPSGLDRAYFGRGESPSSILPSQTTVARRGIRLFHSSTKSNPDAQRRFAPREISLKNIGPICLFPIRRPGPASSTNGNNCLTQGGAKQ